MALLGKHVESRRDVNVRLDDDAEEPWITGCAIMPNGSILICDRRNAKLKLFDSSWVYQDRLAIPDVICVSVVDHNTVIVAVPNELRLQFVQVVPKLQLGRAIQLEKTMCWGVSVSGNDLYVICGDPYAREIRVLDLEGILKRRITTDTDSSPAPYEIKLSLSGEKIFFTDARTDIISCLTVDGEVVYQYRDANVKDGRGVCCDVEDNLFVCDFSSNSVQAVTADGKNGCTLLTQSDGLDNPGCIEYKGSDNELIVGCYKLDHLLVYKMTD